MRKPDVATTVWIARPPEDIWEYLGDVPNEMLWRFGVESAEWASQPPYGLGSTGLHIVKLSGHLPWKVVEWEEPRTISWEFTGGRLEGSRAGYRIAPEEAGSRVTLHVTVKPSALWRILILVMKRGLRRQLAGDLERLKAILEA